MDYLEPLFRLRSWFILFRTRLEVFLHKRFGPRLITNSVRCPVRQVKYNLPIRFIYSISDDLSNLLAVNINQSVWLNNPVRDGEGFVRQPEAPTRTNLFGNPICT